MEECPFCGRELPLNVEDCPDCGNHADMFFFSEQVMASKVRRRTFSVPSGEIDPSNKPIVSRPTRKRKAVLSKGNRGNGRGTHDHHDGSEQGAPRWK